MKISKRRDLTIIQQNDCRDMVITCDSCGGIGLKKGDVFMLPPFYVGKFTARVALLELLCSGAEPIVVSNGVSCEMEPTGKEIIKGIKAELEVAGYKDTEITGSTEENFKTSMTSVGMTMIGMGAENGLLFKKGEVGDKVILFGEPKVGKDVDLEDNSVYEIISFLKKNKNIKEIVPVGSKGILYEARTLAELSGLKFSTFDVSIDLNASAGPATCIIALSEAEMDEGVIIGELS